MAGGGGAERFEEEVLALREEAEALRARNAALEAVLEVINDAVFLKDPSGRYRIINSAGARLLGRSVEEVIGKDDAEVFAPDTAGRIRALDREVLAEGTARTFEEEATAAGVTRSYLVTKGPYRDERGRVVGVIGISRDITDRKRAEAALVETREFLERLLDHTPAQIYVVTRDGRARLVNRTWETTFGRRREEVVGREVGEFFPAAEAARFLAQNREVVETGAPLELDEVVDAVGGRRDIHTVKFPLYDGSRRIDAVGGISFDITERKRVERSLDESRRRLQALFDNILDAIWLLDDAGRFVDANPAMCELLGYTREEFLRMGVEDIAPGRELARELWRKILAVGRLSGEFTQVRKDGTTREVDFRAVADILPGLHLSVNRDITERKRAELELRESERQVRLLLDSTGEAIYGIDLEGRCTLCNAASIRLLGYADASDLLGKDMHRLVHHTRADGSPYPPEACRIFLAFRQGEGAHVEDEVLWRADGTSFPAEYWSYPVRRAGAVVGAVVTFVDITERRRVEEKMRGSAARLLELSRRVVEVQEQERRHLARELHDEIGQTLTAIGIGLQTARRTCGDQARPQIDECIGIVDRVIRQVRHLSLDLRPSMLDDLGLVAALRWYVDRQAQRVGYQARFAAEPGEIRLEPAVATAAFRVAQEALTNVARHARARRVRVALRLRAGTLRVVVADDGAGFDPAAAVRRTARGEGLGLVGMRERATLLGGRVAIRSAPGRGTAVRLKVPPGSPGEGA